MDKNTSKAQVQPDQGMIYHLEGETRLRTALPSGMQHALAVFAVIQIEQSHCNGGQWP